MTYLLLNFVLFVPLIGALLLAVLPRENPNWIKWGAFGISLLTFVLSVALVPDFRGGASLFSGNASNPFQLMTDWEWIPKLGIHYKIGVDGISLVLILLTTLLSSVAILSSFEAVTDRVKEYYIFLLVLETGMLGVFVSLDLILFYVFWEAMLIPMYFLIGVWGGPRRLYATIKFVLYTLTGSLLMLVAIIWLYVASNQSGVGGTFDLVKLTDPLGPIANSTALGPDARFWLFMAFALAFAIKVPMWPFHTWLPDAHVEAPTAGSVILAGVLLKMGTYGFLRFCIPIFPDVAIKVAPWMMGLSVVGIIWGALVAYVQKDIKRLVAYSSVSHLGFCVLGLFAFTREGVAGSVLQMVNHGLSTGALFLIVGMIYERRHTRDISQFGGLWAILPVFAAFFLITTLSSVGLPGLNGFVGEFMILVGTWGPPNAQGHFPNQWFSILAATGVILGAVYMLWLFQRMMQGPVTNPENRKLKDLSAREVCVLLPLVIAMFWIGIYPSSATSLFDTDVYTKVLAPIDAARNPSAAAPRPSSLSPNGLPPGLNLPPGTKLPPGMKLTPDMFNPSHRGVGPSRPIMPRTSAPSRPSAPIKLPATGGNGGQNRNVCT